MTRSAILGLLIAATVGVFGARAADAFLTSEFPVDHPWWTCPDPPDTQQRYYPEKAQQLGVQATADIQCRILASGKPSACAWISESRPNFRFGDYASKIGCLMRFKPATGADGTPQPGIFRTTIRFRLQGG